MTPYRILLLAGRYGLSGVPLAQLRLARVLAGRGHRVRLVYGMLNPGMAAPAAEGVEIGYVNQPRVSGMIGPLMGLLRSYEPDLVLSAGDHLNAVVLFAAALSRSKAKISCSSRVTPFDTYSGRLLSKGWLLKQAMRLAMPRADALTCVSRDMVDQYRAIFPGSRHVCVYNIVDDEFSRSADAGADGVPPRDHGTRAIIAAGALEPWKGFADLIDAMAIVVRSADARLTILGEGSQRAELQRRIDAFGLSDRVTLRGNVADPLNHFARSDVFVLSSHVEGLPNVLVEAMLCGCTPVAADCPTGPREVLADGRYGRLVPVADPPALAAAILAAFETPTPTPLLREAVEPFRADHVIARHAVTLGIDWL